MTNYGTGNIDIRSVAAALNSEYAGSPLVDDQGTVNAQSLNDLAIQVGKIMKALSRGQVEQEASYPGEFPLFSEVKPGDIAQGRQDIIRSLTTLAKEMVNVYQEDSKPLSRAG